MGNFSNSLKCHIKCVLKTEKSSFDERILSYRFNIYFIYSPLIHKLKSILKRIFFFAIFSKSMKIHLKRVYKNKKSSFDKKLLLDTLNMHFYTVHWCIDLMYILENKENLFFLAENFLSPKTSKRLKINKSFFLLKMV